MDGSGTIRVLKRDGSTERFDARKLSLMLWRGMQRTEADFHHARQLSEAIEVFMLRNGRMCVSSAAVFEMAIKSLKCIKLSEAIDAIESHRAWRNRRRRCVRVRHEDGRTTLLDKTWLCELARRSWFLMPETSRIIAAEVEGRLLSGTRLIVPRNDVLRMLNAAVMEFDLADVVPVSAGGDW